MGLYFDHVNKILPLLHRPTFEHGIRNKLYLKDEGYGSVLLLVCACAARFSEDPRVIPPGSDDRKLSGLHWFEQVRVGRNLVLDSPCLSDLQVCCVCVIFSFPFMPHNDVRHVS